MKRIYTLIALAMTLAVANIQAQDCADLIISEVVEGWSNNKALEIYNPTPNACLLYTSDAADDLTRVLFDRSGLPQ